MLNDTNPPASPSHLTRTRSLFIAAVVGFNLLVIAALIALWFIGRRPSPDWNGTWKLDPAKSHYPEPTLTVSITPDGMVHSGSGSATLNFRCDGKPFPASQGFTVTCTHQTGSEMEIAYSKNGAKEITDRWDLSSNQKMLTVTWTNAEPTAWMPSGIRPYTRTAGSTGFAGTWRDVNPLDRMPSAWQIRLQGHTLQESWPEKHWTLTIPLDGKDVAVHRAGVNPAATIALRVRNSRDLTETSKLNGKVINVASWTISPDGRSLTESWWTNGKLGTTSQIVYDKQ